MLSTDILAILLGHLQGLHLLGSEGWQHGGSDEGPCLLWVLLCGEPGRPESHYHQQHAQCNIELPHQGVVTPIGAVLTAETGDTTRSPGHGGFFLSVTGSLRLFEVSRDPLEGGVILTN